MVLLYLIHRYTPTFYQYSLIYFTMGTFPPPCPFLSGSMTNQKNCPALKVIP